MPTPTPNDFLLGGKKRKEFSRDIGADWNIRQIGADLVGTYKPTGNNYQLIGGATGNSMELYHASSAPYIDFHRAANPAGDSNADFNVRLINDSANVLRLSTATAADSTTGGRFHIGNSWVGSHPVHGASWAAFGHQSRLAAADYQFLAASDGSTLINSGSTGQKIQFFLNGVTNRLQLDTNGIHVGGLLAMQDNVIRLRAYTDSAHRIEYQSGVDATVHTMNSNVRFASTSQYVTQIDVNGNVIARFQDGNSKVRLGGWAANGVMGGIFNQVRMDGNSAHYMVMHAANDANQYYGVGASPGYHIFRDANNGADIFKCRYNGDLQAPLPALGGGNTMNIQAGGSNQFGYIASARKYKKDIRPLDKSGADNPVFQLRPVSFKWNDKVGNYDLMEFRYPNGVAGLIAEEVDEVMPDAVLWSDGDNDPWEINGARELEDWVLPESFGIVEITGLDNDRLIAYLIDAVIYLKGELDDRGIIKVPQKKGT